MKSKDRILEKDKEKKKTQDEEDASSKSISQATTSS